MLLAEARTPREVAEATGRLKSTIRTHVKHMFAKHRRTRPADLARLVRSLAGVPKSWRWRRKPPPIGAHRARSPANVRITPENLRTSPILGTRASVRLASSVIRIFRGGGCVGALKHVIADGMALPALLRAGRWKGADAVHGYTATSTDPGSRSPIPIRRSMQTRQFQRPPAVRAPFVAPASATRGRRPSRPTPRVPAPAASLLRARAAVVAKNHSTSQAGFPQKAEGVGFV